MKRTRQITQRSAVIALLLFSLILGACASRSAAPYPQPVEKEISMESPASAPRQKAEGGMAQTIIYPSSADEFALAGERVVLKNASLSLIVPDPAASMDRIGKMAEEMEGFIVSANMYQQTLSNGATVPHASISVRVPSKRLYEALDRIKAESQQEPLSANITSDDVTSQYTDLQSRLSNLEAAEKELKRIMEQAQKTEEVLSVYNQLVATREQIEVIKGQLNYYSEAARLSLISVELTADAAVQPITIGGWQPVGVAKKAIQALIDTLQFLMNAAIWLVIYILPVLLILYGAFFLPLRLLWRFLRRGRSAKKQAQVTPPPEKSE